MSRQGHYFAAIVAGAGVAAAIWYFNSRKKENCCCPPGSEPSYLDEIYSELGSVKKTAGGCEYYEVGAGSSKQLCVIAPDVWGFAGGRTRQIADYMAKCGFYCVIPAVLSPSFEGGTKGDGLPPNFDMSKRGSEFKPWLAPITWDKSVGPKMKSLFSELDASSGLFDASKSTVMIGFCYGGWLCTKCATDPVPLSKSMTNISKICIPHPSIQIEEAVFGGDISFCEKVKSEVLLLPASNDSDRFREGGDILVALQKGNPKSTVDSSVGSTQIHGWVPRADISDPSKKAAVKAAIEIIVNFFSTNSNL
jgi:dienelactone hydrolase